MADELLPLVQVTNREYERSVKASQRRLKQKEKEKERNKKATAKKKTNKSEGGPLAFLASTNEWLEDVPLRIAAAYENFVKNGENLVQSKVDVFCAWMAWKVNIAIERKRQTVLRILHEQYKTTMGGKVMRVANAIKEFFSDPLRALGTLASAIFGPVAAVFKWIAELTNQVIKLAANFARIMAVLPPSPPNPHINYDKFKLKVKSISLKEIAAGPDNLPSPEAMFPEPKKPFSKETFKDSFERATASLKSRRKKYVLSEEDKNMLSGFDIGSPFSQSDETIA